ncbi:MAG: hypothetical protein ACFBWO_00055 [Paracoccaceae bacterium]
MRLARGIGGFLRWFVSYSGVGITISVVYLIFVLRYFVIRNPEFYYMTPNEVGDFMAGVLGPLATFWLILGFFQQGRELRNSTIALRQQSREFSKTVQAQQAQIKYDLAYRRYQIEQVDRSSLPILELEVLSCHQGRRGVLVTYLAVRNFGASILAPSLHREDRLVAKLPTLSFGEEYRFEVDLRDGARERMSVEFGKIDDGSGRQAWVVVADGGEVRVEGP